jgi:hypothetical protein
MVEAVRTTASPGAIWAIVIVAVVVLAIWLVGMFVADHMQVRASGRARAATWPSYLSPSVRESGAGEMAAEIPGQAAAREPAETSTRSDIPAQRAGTGRGDVPTQRTGDTDRPEPTYTGSSYAGQRTPDEEDPGR